MSTSNVDELNTLLTDLNLETNYFAAYSYENKYIVAYKDNLILIAKPDGIHDLHWNLTFPVIEEIKDIDLIYSREEVLGDVKQIK